MPSPQQVAQFFSALAQTQTAEMFEPREFIASQGKVVVLGAQRWRVNSTGSVYEDEWAHVFTILDGRITKFQEYYDTAAEAAAHGGSRGV
jgi:ketosteroid isomerase-like protein